MRRSLVPTAPWQTFSRDSYPQYLEEQEMMSRDLDSIERMRDSATGGGKRPEAMSPPELHATLWKILTFRDLGRCFCFVLC